MVDLNELIRLHKVAQGSTNMGDTAAFIFAISHACDDGLLERMRTAEARAEPSDGWPFVSDDGQEWSAQHPHKSGEDEFAEDVRPATATLLRQFLFEAWIRERDLQKTSTDTARRAEAAESRISELRAECTALAAHQCATPSIDEYGNMVCTSLAALKAENERLRDGMRELIAAVHAWAWPVEGDRVSKDHPLCIAASTARAALAKSRETK